MVIMMKKTMLKIGCDNLVNVKDMKWSFSRLNAFTGCKYAWYLTYVEKRKGLDNAFTQYGIFMHHLLEKYAKGEIPAQDLVKEYIKHYKKHVPFQFPNNAFCDLGMLYYTRGEKYLEEFKGFGDYTIVSSEKEYIFDFEGYKCTAIIDLIVRNSDGKLEIIDHKSKSEFKTKKEMKEYARQLYFYCIPIYDMYKEYPVKMTFNMFQKQNMVSINFDMKEFEETKQWVLETIQTIEKEDKWQCEYDSFFCSCLCSHRKTCMYNDI